MLWGAPLKHLCASSLLEWEICDTIDYMEGVGSLNIEYFFARLYQAFSGVEQVDLSQVPTGALFLVQVVAIVGVVLSVVLLVLTIHFHIRTLQVEHAGFHALEAAHHAHHDHVPPKNPRWEGVVLLANSSNESDWRRGILEADILLGALLTEKGYMGESIGDQLKNANPLQFTTLDLAWEAHRMRNAIAHLGDAFPLSERDTRATIEQYRRVFEEFDYI